MLETRTLRSSSTRLALVLALAGSQAAYAAVSPELACQAGKNQASGKYAACIARAEKSLVATGDTAKYSASRLKCEEKLSAAWAKLQFKAVVAGSSCPTNGDGPAIEDFVDACGASVAEAVSGGVLPLDVITCHDDLDTCDIDSAACEGDLATCEANLATANGDLSDCEDDIAFCEGLAFERLARTGQSTCYTDIGDPLPCAGTGEDGDTKGGAVRNDVDNGDGTITDKLTGLMWEKLSNDGSIHDKDNIYTGQAAAIAKATALNSMAFAGYTDWRLPNRRELESIISLSTFNMAVPAIFNQACPVSCTVLTCSCVKNSIYWSSTAYHPSPQYGWVIHSIDGDIYYVDRATNDYYARAVRSAY